MSDCIALIPAAGSGSRMGDVRPKQYLQLLGRPMLLHTAERLCAHARLRAVYVALSPQDRLFSSLETSRVAGKLHPLYCGGESRAHTVRNALEELRPRVSDADWILVHDAARPCLAVELIDRLIDELEQDEVGGLLAVPVADTLKRADRAQRVVDTVSRDGYWQAQTPQMFRYALLQRALAAADLALVTDEAGAVEALGLSPRLVSGSTANIKVTFPQDFALAEAILRMQGVRE
ncbi:MAG TPA: 2-C-methyl-D-erythritol 4-phosphate cytidylyltransferase [Burkholderiales bacterium]|nr:2-C-methyl-D-erythritol 4-phosphate cytidylyltransferase [Burkholderiales bacterium]